MANLSEIGKGYGVNIHRRGEKGRRYEVANGRKVWECYAVGFDPENADATNDFRITSFPMLPNGMPDTEHIVFDPPPARWNVPATYKVKGAVNLDDVDWPEVTEGNKASLCFFKVEGVLP